MGNIISREIRLASRPQGMPVPRNFTMASVEVGSPQEGEVLVRNLFMSVDPYMRGRMREGKSYVPPFEIGKPLEGGAVGEVIESKADRFQPGDIVLSNFGWREYFISNPRDLRAANRKIQLSRVESKPATEGRIKTSQSEAGLFISFLLFHARCLAAS